MTLAVNALQKAIYTRLTSQLSTPVYNHVPQASAFPYVVIGEKTSAPWRGKTDDGQECTITLHVWSNAAGDKECADILVSLYAALDRQEANVSVTGYTLILLECDFTQVLPDYGNDGDPDHYYHGVMRMRALIQG